MRIVGYEVVRHQCYLPREGKRQQWICPICEKSWSISGTGSGSSNSTQETAEIESFTMKYRDGSKKTFHVRGRGIGDGTPVEKFNERFWRTVMKIVARTNPAFKSKPF